MSIKDQVEKDSDSWAQKSGPKADVQRTFPAGKGQVDDHAPTGGYLGQTKRER